MSDCSKIPFASRTKATIAMSAIRRKKTARGLKGPTGAYLCGPCKSWHLTSGQQRRRRPGRRSEARVDHAQLVRHSAAIEPWSNV